MTVTSDDIREIRNAMRAEGTSVSLERIQLAANRVIGKEYLPTLIDLDVGRHIQKLNLIGTAEEKTE
tara:strand:+ start:576 stop:776 length:201 start_codon:yes stop_codon:yes gene_type:complete